MTDSSGPGCNEELVIVGGGMVGLSLALALAAQSSQAAASGHRVTLVEAVDLDRMASGSAASPSFDARATVLSASAIEFLEKLGVWERLRSSAAPLHTIHVSEEGALPRTQLVAAEEGRKYYGQVVLNSALGNALHQAVRAHPAIELRSPVSASSLRPVPGGMEIGVGDREDVIRANLVVLADGGRSNLAQRLGIGVDRKDYGQTAIVANVEVSEPEPGAAFERFTQGGALAFLPLVPHEGRSRYAVIWTHPSAEGEEIAKLDDAAFSAALEQAFGMRLGRLKVHGKRSSYPVSMARSLEQVRPGLVLLGNAAHTLHPVAGQGFNLSLRDVEALASHLRSLPDQTAPGDIEHLQAFAAGRLKDQLVTMTACDSLVEVFGARRGPLRMLRGAGLFALDMVPGLRRRITRLGMFGAVGS